MSIKKQRIILFIPILNLLNAFFWIYACSKYNVGIFQFIKRVAFVFLLLFVVSIPEIIIDNICEISIICSIADFVFLYLRLFLISLVAVKHQETILKGQNTECDSETAE